MKHLVVLAKSRVTLELHQFHYSVDNILEYGSDWWIIKEMRHEHFPYVYCHHCGSRTYFEWS